MRRFLIAAGTAAAILGAGAVPVSAGTPQRHAPVHRTVMADCEDADIQPCLTFDEGRWRMVLSYKPYAYRTVNTCRKVARTYPCMVQERNGALTYLWRKSF